MYFSFGWVYAAFGVVKNLWSEEHPLGEDLGALFTARGPTPMWLKPDKEKGPTTSQITHTGSFAEEWG